MKFFIKTSLLCMNVEGYVKTISLFLIMLIFTLPAYGQNSLPPAQPCDCDNSCKSSQEQIAGIVEPKTPNAMRIMSIRPNKENNFGDLGIKDPIMIQSLNKNFSSNNFSTQFFFNDLPVGIGSTISGASGADLIVDGQTFNNLFEKSEWAEGIQQMLQGGHNPFRMIDPILTGGKKSISDVVNVPIDRISHCKTAVTQSQRKENTECALAVKSLCPSNYSGCDPDELSSRMTEKDIFGELTTNAKITISSLDRYDQVCLDSDGDPTALDKSHFDLDYIRERTGVLRLNTAKATNALCQANVTLFNASSSSDGVFCSAAVLDNNSLITARHCFASNNKRWKPVYSCLSDGAVEFSSYARPSDSITIQRVVDPEDVLARSDNPSEDYLELELSTDIPNINDLTNWRLPKSFDEVLVMAFHQLVPPISNKTNSWPRWRRQVRFTRPNCTITRISNECAITKCQTIAGFSGVPVWTIDSSGDTALSAIQVEGGTSSYSTCGTSPSQSFVGQAGNLAIWGFANDQ